MKRPANSEKAKSLMQFGYAVTLIALIPVLIILNTVFIVNRYSQTLDLSLQQRALSVARTIAVMVRDDLDWEFFVQHRLDRLSESNVGVKSVSILKPDDSGGFKVAASSAAGAAGAVLYEPFYSSAWQSRVYDGLATDSIRFSASLAEPESGRNWLTAMPISGESGGKQALLVLELSASLVDEAAAAHKQTAALIVVITVVIVILFLSVVFRLWDYAALYRRAKEIEGLKSEFVSMASHELRAPITAISGFAQLLYNEELGPLGEKAKDGLKHVLLASGRLAQLVDDLLDAGQIEQGRMLFRPVRARPDKIIRETIGLFAWQARDKNLALSFHPHADKLPELMIDKDRFKQVMSNLLSNAIKYSRAGEIQVVTRALYNQQILEILVKDTGVGLSEEQRSRLFEKFYRAKNPKAGKQPGTGLGLWLTKELVEMMHGKIAVESIEDVGTQFALRFPVADYGKPDA